MTRSTPAKDQTMTLNVPNLDRLISHLEALPPEEFNMKHGSKVDHSCGTACCIAGYVRILWPDDCSGQWVDSLGEFGPAWKNLVTPEGWEADEEVVAQRYPLSRALRMLRHLRAEYLRTGSVVVDWDAPEAVEAPHKPWAPPVVLGADKPLPVELTRWVRDPVAAEPIPQGERHGC